MVLKDVEIVLPEGFGVIYPDDFTMKVQACPFEHSVMVAPQILATMTAEDLPLFRAAVQKYVNMAVERINEALAKRAQA
jgi:hypothetical protein